MTAVDIAEDRVQVRQSDSHDRVHGSPVDELDTFPKLLLNHALQRGDKPAIREKDFGIWQFWTWRQMADEIRAFACGLADLGFQQGDKLAIIGDNRPQMYWAVAATQCLGGVPLPLYQDAVAEEMAYVLNDADVRFVVVEDQEQVDKVLEIKDRCPLVEVVIYDDPRGCAITTNLFCSA